MEILKDLPPQTAAILLGLWFVREIFGFVLKLIKEFSTLKKPSESYEVLQTMSRHTEALANLMRDFAYELKEIKGQLSRLEGRK